MRFRKVSSSEDVLELSFSLPRVKHQCPRCGEETDRVHDYRKQKVKDIKCFGKNVVLYLRKRRYVCPCCGKRFSKKFRVHFKRSRSLMYKNPKNLKDEEMHKLELMFEISPRMARAYYLKNKFLGVIHAKNSVEGAKKLANWLMLSECEDMGEFKNRITAYHNWSREILNSLDFHIAMVSLRAVTIKQR